MKHFFYTGLLVLGFSQFLSGNVIQVCPACPVKGIQEAIELASPGDEIRILKGTYLERGIQVNKPVSIVGINYPIVDGQNNGEIFTILANDVSIEGMDIRNVGTSYTEDFAGIRANNVRNFTIKNNKLTNAFFAIYLAYARNGQVLGNQIYGKAENEVSSGNGIHLWYCKNIRIEDNTVIGARDGIYFEFADSCTIVHNHSEGNIRYGLHFMFSNNDSYSCNTFVNNGAGVAVMFSKKIEMFENTFERNWGSASYGLLLKEIYDTEIYNNRFLENTIGINLEGATRIIYRDNEFQNNGWALRISGGCVDNTFTRNNFLSNTFDLSMQSAGTNNHFKENYWSAYTGYDLDRDGVGDVPYRPVKLFSYIVNQTPEAMVLLRSLFIDLLNFSEKVSPVLTPADILDEKPLMRKISLKG